MSNLDLLFSENFNSQIYAKGVDDISSFLHQYGLVQNLNNLIFYIFAIVLGLVFLSLIFIKYNKSKLFKYTISTIFLLFCCNTLLIGYVDYNSDKNNYELTYNPPIGLRGISSSKIQILYSIEDEKIGKYSPITYLNKKDFKELLVKKQNEYCLITLIPSDNTMNSFQFLLLNNKTFEECL